MKSKPQTILTGDRRYPEALRKHLGEECPNQLVLRGAADLLLSPTFYKVALLGSAMAPDGSIAKVRGLARSWQEARGIVVISGFHSPVEQSALDVLLEEPSAVIICPPKGIAEMGIKRQWRKALSQGRLLLLSFFPNHITHTTSQNAQYRNRCLAALAEQVVIAHAQPGSKTEKVALEALMWKKEVYSLGNVAKQNFPVLQAGRIPKGAVIKDESIPTMPEMPDKRALAQRLRESAITHANALPAHLSQFSANQAC